MTAKNAAWFGTFACYLTLAMSLIPQLAHSGGAYIMFFSFFPVVLFSFARQQQSSDRAIADIRIRIEAVTNRIKQLEGDGTSRAENRS
jgi:hypothetical protein